MGSHWSKKNGSKPQKIGMPKNSNFRNGVPLEQKKWVKAVKFTKPQNSNFPRSSISAKIGPYCYSAKSRWGPPRVHLGANGVPLELKNGSKLQKLAMLQNSNFRLPRGHRFRQKLNLTVLEPNHGGDPLGSILGPMGSHWS